MLSDHTDLLYICCREKHHTKVSIDITIHHQSLTPVALLFPVILHGVSENCVLVTWNTNQASRYAIQHTWCLFQARINWEGCGRKGIWRKIGGMMEVGALLVWMGWRPAGLSVHLPLLSSARLIKSRMMTDSHNMFQV